MMTYSIKDIQTLRRLLWLDAAIGGTTGMVGLVFSTALTLILGLETPVIVVIAIITLLYAIGACTLAMQPSMPLPAVRTLVGANWLWTVVSVALVFVHYAAAEPFGKVFLIAQIVVVGGLAYLEGNQIANNK
jgi:hypothetical protein